MMTAVLHQLHRRFAAPCTVIGAGTWNSQLYAGHPDIAGVWTFTRHVPFMLGLTWWRVARELRRSHPSPIYVLESQPRQLGRIRRMLAWSGIDPSRCVFATDEPSQNGEHRIDLYTRVIQRTPAALNPADYPVAQLPRNPTPRLRVLQLERDSTDRWLRSQGCSGQKLVLIQSGNFRTMSRRRDQWARSNGDDKAWPAASWASLVQKIHAKLPDAVIVFCGAPSESDMLQRLKEASGLSSVLTANVPLRELLALCERAHSMLSIDTGPAHIAAALGVPLVVMYGAEPPTRWLPRSPSGSPVIPVGGPPASARVDQIPVDVVFEAWCSLHTAAAPASQVLDQSAVRGSTVDLEPPATRYAN